MDGQWLKQVRRPTTVFLITEQVEKQAGVVQLKTLNEQGGETKKL